MRAHRSYHIPADRARLDGLLATTEYCSIRKRQYRQEWLAGLDIRQGRMPRTNSTVPSQEVLRDD